MDSSSSGEPPPPLTLCPCSCTFCCHSSSATWHRSVKRKAESTASDSIASSGVVRVETETEIEALRETVAKQLETIQELSTELDEERNAAASAANEAMAMILKLQREKADAQMEARQFKRFAEEKMAHDNDELFSLEDLLLRREEMLQTLSAKLYAYHMKFEKLGFTELDLEGEARELDLTNYPPLKCAELVPEQVGNEEVLEIYEFGDNPAEDLNEIENRIFNLEKEEEEEEREEEEREGDLQREAEVQREEEQVKRDDDGDGDDDDDDMADDTSDRVYTIDTVHGPSTPMVKVSEDNDVDIKKLYMRLEVLEADRESMRQALIAMRTEKTQFVLLQEIAQRLSKEVMYERKLVKKKSFIEAFSIMALFKWLFSHVWKPKVSRVRYTFGLSTRNLGLLILLDKTPQMSHLRRHSKVHVSMK